MSDIVFEISKNGNKYICEKVHGDFDIVTPFIEHVNSKRSIVLKPKDESIKILSLKKVTVDTYLFKVERTTGFIIKTKEMFNVYVSVDEQKIKSQVAQVRQVQPQVRQVQPQVRQVQPQVRQVQPQVRRQYKSNTPSMINPILSSVLIADGIVSGNFVESYAGGLIMGSGLFD